MLDDVALKARPAATRALSSHAGSPNPAQGSGPGRWPPSLFLSLKNEGINHALQPTVKTKCGNVGGSNFYSENLFSLCRLFSILPGASSVSSY